MANLLFDDEDAQRLSKQTKTLSELLLATEGWKPPKLHRRALMHIHCHSRAVLNAEAEHKLLQEMGLDVQIPKVGCCGQAGSFGYEADHYDVAMKVGEQVCFPRFGKRPPETLIVADGFSCREQVRHATNRWAMHPAEVLALALELRGDLPAAIPERRYLEEPARADLRTAGLVAASVAAVALLATAAARRA